MRKSASKLGEDYGLTGQEMNFLLKEEGFLVGKPGNYTVTENGEKYAQERDHHRGTGGYAHYNRYWTTRTWDEGIVDELSITEERKKELRRAISESKLKLNELENEDLAVKYDNDTEEYSEESDDRDVLAEVASALIIAVSTYGIYKATPYVKNWWHERAFPGMLQMKNKVIEASEKIGKKS